VRLATSGTLAGLWNSKGQERGNGVPISLLPILALHVAPKDGRTWTGWRRIAYLDFAELAGISPNSVGNTIARLRKAGLLQRRTMWRTGGKLTYIGSKKAKHMVFYRLNAKEVYPQQDEPWATLPASFFESGTWARLTSAEQALYLVRWCLRARPEGFSFAELEELSGLPRPSLDRALKLLEKKTGKTLVQRRSRGRPRKAGNNPS
jgi:DNA-binding transcriptional ArsR family regulator